MAVILPIRWKINWLSISILTNRITAFLAEHCWCYWCCFKTSSIDRNLMETFLIERKYHGKRQLQHSHLYSDLSTNRIVCMNFSLKWYRKGALLHLRFFLLLWKRFSAFLNTRHKSNTFPDISHLFYKLM